MKDQSYDQRKYYWGVIVARIAIYRGWDSHYAHDWIKLTFNLKTTTGMSTVQFEDLLNRIRVFTNLNWHLVIPLPKENLTNPDYDYLPPDIRGPEGYSIEEEPEGPAIENEDPGPESDKVQYCF